MMIDLMPHPTQKRKWNGTLMVLVAGPFEQTEPDKSILGRMISLYLKAGTKFYIQPKQTLGAKRLFLWRDVKGYKTGNSTEAQGKSVGSTSKNFRPKVWRTGPRELNQ